MAKTKISEYDVVASNNTDVDGVNIAESCPPSGINNAIREVMAHLKDFQSGTSGDKLPLASGGTNAGTAADARTNLGLGTIATLNSITSAYITDGTIATADIADDAVTSAKIADLTITTGNLANDAVTSAKIGTNAVNATALNVSGNGTSGQFLSSDGDGSFSWTSGTVTGNNQANGHFKLSNGLIVNWGNTGTISNGGYKQVTFNRAYTTAMYGFYAFTSIGNSYTGGSEQWTTNRTLSGLRLYHRGFDTYLGSNSYWWISVGY